MTGRCANCRSKLVLDNDRKKANGKKLHYFKKIRLLFQNYMV